jgi:hypothetical protein
MYIDGDIWLADGGRLLRVVNGRTDSWSAADPGDAIVRPAPRYTLVSSGSDRREGHIYAFDATNRRVVSFLKADGTFVEQYRLAGESTGWSDMRSWYVAPGAADQPDVLYWVSANAIHRTVLEPLTSTQASPGPSGAAASTPASAAPASGAP